MVLLLGKSNQAKLRKEYDMSDKILYYSEYGAAGDGISDDFDAIIRTHAAANDLGLPVHADPGATYYIGGGSKTAQIQTDTDWGTARFIIDDTKVEDRNSYIFHVTSKHSPIRIDEVKSLKKNQENININLEFDSLVTAIDDTTMRFIREGLNVDNGTQQTDVFIVNKKGEVDSQTAIIWDYTNITSLIAYPIDSETLTIQGGHFTTIANQEEPKYNYFSRNIAIQRSNVVINGLTHIITDEPEEHSAPYNGFIFIRECSNVKVQNCKMSAHKTYTTIGRANLPVSMGSYDILVNCAANILFKDCVQLNDITDNTKWGIFGSNFTKNITFDTVVFSRFDAHMGTTNPVIINSEIGYMGIKLIGSGTCLIENTKVIGNQFISLRDDYGSTWEGEIIIRNCELTPHKIRENNVIVLDARYSGMHDFGYACFMPRRIIIDGLVINDYQSSDDYEGPRILSPIHTNYLDDSFKEKYPYALPEEIEIKGFVVKSGKKWVLSDNMYLFRNVKVGH